MDCLKIVTFNLFLLSPLMCQHVLQCTFCNIVFKCFTGLGSKLWETKRWPICISKASNNCLITIFKSELKDVGVRFGPICIYLTDSSYADICNSFSFIMQFGCLSSRYFYQCLKDVYNNVKRHTSPPVSLVGQVCSPLLKVVLTIVNCQKLPNHKKF